MRTGGNLYLINLSPTNLPLPRRKTTMKAKNRLPKDMYSKKRRNKEIPKEPVVASLIQHELNFFEFETKMRKVMYDIIEPNTKRVNSQSAQINDLEKQLKKSNLEIQELQAFLFKGKKNKQSTIDEIYIKIADIEKDRKMEEANIMFELHKFDKKLSDMDFNYKATREENSILRDRIKACEENIFKFNHNLKSMKDAFLLKLSDTYEKLFGQIEAIQEVANRADQQSKVNKAKINTMDAQIQSDRKLIDSNSNNNIRLESKLERLNQITVKESKYKEDIKNIEDNMKRLEVKEDDFTNHLATIENYVEKYLPAQIQMQITEAIKGILPKRELRKFDDFQKKIFEKINKVILADDGIPDVLSKIKQTRNLINAGTISYAGAMFCVLDSKSSPLKVENLANDDSPHKSETSHMSFSKSAISKKNTEMEAPQEVPLSKTKSNFSKHKEEGHRHISSIHNNDKDANNRDYAQFNMELEGATHSRKFSVKHHEKDFLNSPGRIHQSLDDVDQDQKQLFSEENEESEHNSQNFDDDKPHTLLFKFFSSLSLSTNA